MASQRSWHHCLKEKVFHKTIFALILEQSIIYGFPKVLASLPQRKSFHKTIFALILESNLSSMASQRSRRHCLKEKAFSTKQFLPLS
jgi:hypothetical protein